MTYSCVCVWYTIEKKKVCIGAKSDAKRMHHIRMHYFRMHHFRMYHFRSMDEIYM